MLKALYDSILMMVRLKKRPPLQQTIEKKCLIPNVVGRQSI